MNFNVWCERLFIYGVCAPLELTRSARSPWLRVVGLLAFMVWCLPALALLAVPLLVCIFGSIFEEVWNGRF